MRPRQPIGLTLSALGDSTAVGVGAAIGGGYVDRLYARLVGAGRGQRLINLGVSGATSADVLRDQVPRVSTAQPGLVSIGVGINDVMYGVPPALFARRFEQIIKGVRVRTAVPIVVSNVPDVSQAPAVPAAVRGGLFQRLKAYNALIADLARRHRLLVFDAFTMSQQVISRHPEFFSRDGYHPSDKGYEYWAEQLWRVIKPTL
jgi:lysophospholipase L1-like esterase